MAEGYCIICPPAGLDFPCWMPPNKLNLIRCPNSLRKPLYKFLARIISSIWRFLVEKELALGRLDLLLETSHDIRRFFAGWLRRGFLVRHHGRVDCVRLSGGGFFYEFLFRHLLRQLSLLFQLLPN